jgi:hypothetical protein
LRATTTTIDQQAQVSSVVALFVQQQAIGPGYNWLAPAVESLRELATAKANRCLRKNAQVV